MNNQPVVDSKTTSARKNNEQTPASTPVETKTAATAVTTNETKAPVETSTIAVATKSAGFITGLSDVLATSTSRGGGGGKGAVKLRPNVGYTLVAEGIARMQGTKIPEQQKVVVRLLDSVLTTEKPVISEPELHKLIENAKTTGALKTKQDAWHVFKYYATPLTKIGALKEVQIQLAPAA